MAGTSSLFCESLRDRVILVTGATGHLGGAICRAFAENGCRLVLNSRNNEALQRCESDVRDAGASDVLTVPFDVASPSEVEAGLQRVREVFGELDVIVNNAYSGSTGTVESASYDDFDTALRTNVTGPFAVVKSALDMLEQAGTRNPGGASVINMASMYAVVSSDPRVYGDSGLNNPPQYGPSKAGLLQLTRYLACHLAGRGVRVNAVSPGPFPTDAPAHFLKRLAERTPLGRVGEPEEVSGAVVFLACDAASYITGSEIRVDGGWTAW